MPDIRSSLYGIDRPKESKQCNFTEDNCCSAKKRVRPLISQKENLEFL